VATYLRTGTVPARRAGTGADRSCPRLAAPPPEAAGFRTTARAGR
jgi:hypothetical protein